MNLKGVNHDVCNNNIGSGFHGCVVIRTSTTVDCYRILAGPRSCA